MDLDDILFKIYQANDEELNTIIDAIIDRHSELYPQWDLTLLPLPHNDPQGCVEKLRSITAFMNHHFYTIE